MPPIISPFSARLFFVLLMVVVFLFHLLSLLQGSEAILPFWLCWQAAAFCNGAVAFVFSVLSPPLDQPRSSCFAWLILASVFHREGIFPELSAAAFATLP